MNVLQGHWTKPIPIYIWKSLICVCLVLHNYGNRNIHTKYGSYWNVGLRNPAKTNVVLIYLAFLQSLWNLAYKHVIDSPFLCTKAQNDWTAEMDFVDLRGCWGYQFDMIFPMYILYCKLCLNIELTHWKYHCASVSVFLCWQFQIPAITICR